MDRTPLRLCTWNSRGHGADRLMYIDRLMQQCELLLVQEHWLQEGDLHKLIAASQLELTVFGISGMDPAKLLIGRPYGGCALIHRRDLRCSVTPVSTSSRRLHACIIELYNVPKFLLCNLYMPCDSSHISDHDVYREVLTEIESIFDQHYDVDYVILGGDLNTDLSRVQSVHSVLLNDFCLRHDLKFCLNAQNVDVDFTYCNDATGVQSVLDHVIISENLVSSILSYVVLHDGDNLSDHQPVVLSLRMSPCKSQSVDATASYRPSWPRATLEQKAAYRERLGELLGGIQVPYAALYSEQNSAEMGRRVEEYYTAIMGAMVSATRACIPARKRKAKAGWVTHVKQYQEDSVFWHRMWMSNGKPRTGWINEIRLRTRAQYRRASRWVLRNQDRLSADRMAQSLRGNDARDFWVEAKKMKSGGHSMPSVVDGVEGVEEICSLFKEKYEDLYNSVSFNDIEMNEFLNVVSTKVNTVCEFGSCENHHVMNVDDVKCAVRKLKAGKSDANVNLCSDNFICACNDLFVHLSLLLNMFYFRFSAPAEMLTSILVPIPKNRKKALSNSGNFRSIAISSIVGKILDHIVLKNHSSVLQTSDLQFGFKSEHSTTQCSFILREVVEYYAYRRTPVFVTLLDATRAFDRVHYVKLFKLLMRRGMCPSLIKLLIMMYIGQSLAVRWSNAVSSSFNCTNGIKQGGVLSPVLFCIYIDELINRLIALNVGCFVGHKFVGVMTYADDVTLMAPTYEATVKMLDVCQKHAAEYDILFNSSKSNVILFNVRGRRFMSKPVIKMNNDVIEYKDRAIHLGSHIGSGSDQENIKKAITDLTVKTNFLVNTYRFCDIDVSCYLFNTHCSSFYGAPIWNLNITESLCIAWRRCIRRLLKLHPRTHSRYIPFIIGRLDLRTQFYVRCLKFWNSAILSKNEVLSLCARVAMHQTSSSNVALTLRSIMQMLNVDVDSLLGVNTVIHYLYDRFENSLSDEGHANCSALIELLKVRSNSSECPLSLTEVNQLIDYLSLN